jgi:hypothetical protein
MTTDGRLTIRYADSPTDPRWLSGFPARAAAMLEIDWPAKTMIGSFIADTIEAWPEIRVIPYYDAVLKYGPKVRFGSEEILLEGIVSPNCVATFMRWGTEIVRQRADRARAIADILLKHWSRP